MKCKPTLKIKLSSCLESLMDEFKGLPHGGRNRLRSKSTTVNDFEDFIIQV